MTGKVLVVEDDEALREALCETLEIAGYGARPEPDGRSALRSLDREAVDLVVSDVRMCGLDGLGLLREVKARRPDLPVLLMTAFGNVPEAVEAMRVGAADYLVKPFEAEVLVGKVSSFLPDEPGSGRGVMVAEDPASRELASLAGRVAASDVTVLLTGESGAGKEVLARHVHACSMRATGPFVAVNCAAIPDNMLEAMLFGYEKGAYTGAHKACPGKFEQANGGSLLLDEVSEMDLGLQAKLLRVVQEREVERLGSRGSIALDLRVIATSNRDLPAAVREGQFREDLYYRLAVFPLHVPALRERPGDIVPIACHLAARAAEKEGRRPPRLDEAARERLRVHEWPGNVRELDNVVQRALVLATGDVTGADAIRIDARNPPCERPPERRRATLDAGLRQREERLILEALAAGEGSRKDAARRLGISPRTLRYKLARLRDAGVAVPAARA